MPGTKGMSWKKEKKNSVKINSNIPFHLNVKLIKYANKKKWSISQVIREILENFFQKK
jgi:hypothetical protein